MSGLKSSEDWSIFARAFLQDEVWIANIIDRTVNIISLHRHWRITGTAKKIEKQTFCHLQLYLLNKFLWMITSTFFWVLSMLRHFKYIIWHYPYNLWTKTLIIPFPFIGLKKLRFGTTNLPKTEKLVSSLPLKFWYCVHHGLFWINLDFLVYCVEIHNLSWLLRFLAPPSL